MANDLMGKKKKEFGRLGLDLTTGITGAQGSIGAGKLLGGILRFRDTEVAEPEVQAPMLQDHTAAEEATDFWQRGKRRRRGRTSANILGYNRQRTGAGLITGGGL